MLHMFGNGFQEVLLHPPKDQGELDWPVIPLSSSLPLLKTEVTFAFLQSRGAPLNGHDLSKIRMVSQSYQPTASAFRGASHEVPWVSVHSDHINVPQPALFHALDLHHGSAISESKSDWGRVRGFWSFLTQSCSLAVCVCVCVYSWAAVQTNKAEFCADFPDKLFLLVAQDVSQLPQWASNSIPGEVQLGWKQRQQHTFFFGFLITSVSVSEAFFLKIFTLQVLPHRLSLIITFLIICSH